MTDSSDSPLDSDLPANFLQVLEEGMAGRAEGPRKSKAAEKPSIIKTQGRTKGGSTTKAAPGGGGGATKKTGMKKTPGGGSVKKSGGTGSKTKPSLKASFPSSSEEEERLKEELGIRSTYMRNFKSTRLEQLRKEMEEIEESEEEDPRSSRRTRPKSLLEGSTASSEDDSSGTSSPDSLRRITEMAKMTRRPTDEESRISFLERHRGSTRDELSDEEVERRAELLIGSGDGLPSSSSPSSVAKKEKDKGVEGGPNAPLALSAMEEITRKAGGDGVRQAELKARMARSEKEFEATKRLIEMKAKKDIDKLYPTGSASASVMDQLSNDIRKKKHPFSQEMTKRLQALKMKKEPAVGDEGVSRVLKKTPPVAAATPHKLPGISKELRDSLNHLSKISATTTAEKAGIKATSSLTSRKESKTKVEKEGSLEKETSKWKSERMSKAGSKGPTPKASSSLSNHQLPKGIQEALRKEETLRKNASQLLEAKNALALKKELSKAKELKARLDKEKLSDVSIRAGSNKPRLARSNLTSTKQLP